MQDPRLTSGGTLLRVRRPWGASLGPFGWMPGTRSEVGKAEDAEDEQHHVEQRRPACTRRANA